MAKFITELAKPANMDMDVFREFVTDVYGANVYPGMYRLDKNGPTDRYVFWWNDATGTMPDLATMTAAFQAWRGQGNDDKSLKVERAKAYLLEYDDKKRTQVLGQRVKDALPADPSDAQIKTAIETVVDQWWVDNS